MSSLKDLVEKGDVNFDVDYLSSEDKEQIVEQSQAFTITNVTFQPKSTYGPAWNVEILLAGDERTMTLSAGGARDQYMHDLQEAVERAPITDCYLTKKRSSMGRDAYVIADAPA